MDSSVRPAALLYVASVEAGGTEPFIDLNERMLIAEHLAAFRRAGVRDIALVRAGAPGGPLPGDLSGTCLVQCPSRWSSALELVSLGLFALDHAPVFVMPVQEVPATETTLTRLISALSHAPPTRALVPRFHDRRGYPVLLLRPGVDEVVRETIKTDGAKDLDSLLGHWIDGVRSVAMAGSAGWPMLSARA